MNSAWYNIYATITFVVVGEWEVVALSWDAHRFLYFLRSSYKRWTPFLKTSERVVLSSFLQYSIFSIVFLSILSFISVSNGFSG